MSDMRQYEALLEVYKNQETTFIETNKELEELSDKHQEPVQTLNKLRKEREIKNLELNQKKVKLMERLDFTLNTCRSNDLSWKEIKSKQSCIFVRQDNVNKIIEDEIDLLQDLVKDHKQLDTEICSDKILNKIQEYLRNSQVIKEHIVKSKDDVKAISICPTKLPEFELSWLGTSYRRKTFKKSHSEMNAEIKETKKKLQSIMVQMKELGESA